jgi:NADPH:quinone reductase-like Zn-dependent oxidoreductase
MSTQQKALYLVEPQENYEVRSREIQEPGPGELLVEIRAAALNPSDWKLQAYDIFTKDCPIITGTDSAGIVKKVGQGVANVAVGDKVCVLPSPLRVKHPNAAVKSTSRTD